MKFSIISVTFNNLKGLQKTLNSLDKQIFRDYEMIIVDGDSTDGTQEFIRGLNNPQVKFISEKDKGIYDAQNKGIEISNGEYFLFLNAGDVFENNRVLQTIKNSENSEDIIYGDIIIVDNEKNRIQLQYPDEIPYKYWYNKKYLCHQAVFFHKNVFEKYGNYNLKYRFAADFDLLQRIWYRRDVTKKHVNTFVVVYDLEGVSAKKDNEKIILNEYNRIKKKNHPWLIFYLYRFYYEIPFFNFVRQNINRIIFYTNKFFYITGRIIKRTFFRSDRNLYKNISIDRTNTPFILHFSTSDESGGAAIAALNIHRSLVKNGKNSMMIVHSKKSNDNTVIQGKERTGFYWLKDFIGDIFENRKYNRNQPEKKVMHSYQNFSILDLKLILDILKPDIIHLHWIGFNLFSLESLIGIQIPIVWTMHDMWPFCGAEHVCFNEAYRLGYSADDFVNYLVWERKKKIYPNLKLYPVGVSNWIGEAAKKSILFSSFQIKTIPNILDTEIFFPRDPNFSRSFWSLSLDRIYLVFGAEYKDENKGYQIIEQIIGLYDKEKRSDISFIIFGSGSVGISTEYVEIIHLGKIFQPEHIALLYSASDITLVPSKIESFCLTAAESISCGTPVVSFDTSGLKDIVKDEISGYRSKCFGPIDFKNNIDKLIGEKRKNKFHRSDLHQFIKERFSEEEILRKYLDLYNLIYQSPFDHSN